MAESGSLSKNGGTFQVNSEHQQLKSKKNGRTKVNGRQDGKKVDAYYHWDIPNNRPLPDIPENQQLSFTSAASSADDLLDQKPWKDCSVLLQTVNRDQIYTLEQCNCKDEDLPPVKLQYLLNFHSDFLAKVLDTELGKLKVEVKRINHSNEQFSIEVKSHTDEKIMNEVLFILNDVAHKINYYRFFPISGIKDPELRLKEYIEKGELAIYKDEEKVYVVGMVGNSVEVTEKLKKRLPSLKDEDYDFNEDIQFESSVKLQVLLVFSFVELLQKKFPNVKVKVNEEQCVMSFIGNESSDITGAIEEVEKLTDSLEIRDIELDPLLIQLLKLPKIETFVLDLCKVQNMQVVWDVSDSDSQITCYCRDNTTINIFHDILQHNFTKSTFRIKSIRKTKLDFCSSTTFTDFIDKHKDHDLVSAGDGNNFYVFTTRDIENELIALEVQFKRDKKTEQDNFLQKQRSDQEKASFDFGDDLPDEKSESDHADKAESVPPEDFSRVIPKNNWGVQKLHLKRKFKFCSQLKKLIPGIKIEIDDNEMKFLGCSTTTMIDEMHNFLSRLHNKTVVDIPDSALKFYHTSKIGKEAIYLALCEKNIHCHWYVDFDTNSLQIFTQDKDMLVDAENEIKRVITWCEYLTTEEAKAILESQEMKSFFTNKVDMVQLSDMEFNEILIVGLSDAVQEFENLFETLEKAERQASIVKTEVSSSKPNLSLPYVKRKLRIDKDIIDYLKKVKASEWNGFLQYYQVEIYEDPETAEIYIQGIQKQVNDAVIDLRGRSNIFKKMWSCQTNCPNEILDKISAEAIQLHEKKFQCSISLKTDTSLIQQQQLGQWVEWRRSPLPPIHYVLVHGNVYEIPADVLVCPTNENYEPSSLASVMLNKGGSRMKNDFEQKRKPQGQAIYVSSETGNLPCLMVAYLALPEYKQCIHKENDVVKCLHEIFEEVEKAQLQSLVLPVKILDHVSEPLFLKWFVKACLDYQSHHKVLTEIYLCTTDVDKIDGMIEVLSPGLNTCNSYRFKHLFENPMTPSCGKRNDITISLIKGSLVNQKVDAIVNTSNKRLELQKGAVSFSILKAGGRSILDECIKKYPNGIDFGEVACTSAGKMNFKLICHSALTYNWITNAKFSSKILEKFVFDCLQKAEEKNCKSIALPVVGTGRLEYPWDEVAKTMIEAINKYGRLYNETVLKEVKIVLYDKDEKSIKAFETRKRQTEEIKLVEEEPEAPPTLILESRCKNVRVQVIPLSDSKFHHCEAVVNVLNKSQANKFSQDNPKSTLSTEGIVQMKPKDSDFWTVLVTTSEAEKNYKEVIQKVLQFVVKERIGTLAFCLMEKETDDQVMKYIKQATIIRDIMNLKRNKYLQKVKIIIPSREKFEKMLSKTITKQEEESNSWLSKVGEYVFNTSKTLWKCVSYLDFVESSRLLISVVGEDRTNIAGLKDNLQSMVEDVIKTGGQIDAPIQHDTGKRTHHQPPRTG